MSTWTTQVVLNVCVCGGTKLGRDGVSQGDIYCKLLFVVCFSSKEWSNIQFLGGNQEQW